MYTPFQNLNSQSANRNSRSPVATIAKRTVLTVFASCRQHARHDRENKHHRRPSEPRKLEPPSRRSAHPWTRHGDVFHWRLSSPQQAESRPSFRQQSVSKFKVRLALTESFTTSIWRAVQLRLRHLDQNSEAPSHQGERHGRCAKKLSTTTERQNFSLGKTKDRGRAWTWGSAHSCIRVQEDVTERSDVWVQISRPTKHADGRVEEAQVQISLGQPELDSGFLCVDRSTLQPSLLSQKKGSLGLGNENSTWIAH